MWFEYEYKAGDTPNIAYKVNRQLTKKNRNNSNLIIINDTLDRSANLFLQISESE